jgi:hypothetical protein
MVLAYTIATRRSAALGSTKSSRKIPWRNVTFLAWPTDGLVVDELPGETCHGGQDIPHGLDRRAGIDDIDI